MRNVPRPAPFVLIASNHGTMIVNRNDYRMVDDRRGFGVGLQIMNQSCYDAEEVDFALTLLEARRGNFGPGVVALDCGANIGVHTVEWARLMFDWGRVYAFEAQEMIFYALAGNVAINNCLNATVRHAALGAQCGTLAIPEPNYFIPASYGSLELRGRGDRTEFIGQSFDYSKPSKTVPLVTVDSLGMERLDLMKIDVEGMEMEVLEGATRSLEKFKPNLLVEIVKSDQDAIRRKLERLDYQIFAMGMNLFAAHRSDPLLPRVRVENDMLWFA